MNEAACIEDGWTSDGDCGLAQWALILIQLAALVGFAAFFHIESQAFVKLLGVVLGGFAVHSWLPLRWRRSFFSLLSCAAILIILGPASGALLLAMVVAPVAVAHLPVRFWLRVGLVVLYGAVLWVLRTRRDLPPVLSAVWPVLGSILMFRLMIYFYDRRQEKAAPTWTESLSYFLLVPNVCFPLFPVVDFKTSLRRYYDGPAGELYSRGVHWMLVGMLHLLGYRLVYYYVVIEPGEVVTAWDRVRFLTCDFLLYLRVSGQFHIIVGILMLFGFNLPRTHRFYYFAAGFSDFWRRINIYWKDFMQKVFFYPISFRLRRMRPATAAALSAFSVFVISMVLHAYQTFWLLGTFNISPQDAIFWGTLGVAVVGSSLYEMRKGRKRSLGTPARQGALGWIQRSAATLATFAFISVLWSLWSSPSVGGWWSVVFGPRMGGGRP